MCRSCCWTCVLACLFLPAGALEAQQAPDASTFSFDRKEQLASWKVQGAVSIDNEKARGDSGSSLRVAPGGKAVLELRKTDGGGSLDLWVYDDLTAPAEARKRRVGPRWGLVNADGKVLACGILYAPYLAGDKTYCTTEYAGQTWFKVSYLGESRRSRGWHRWTVTMDPKKGLSISFDGRDVNAKRKRFDWNKSQVGGFAGIAIFGDEKGPGGQTIWVDDVSVELSGKMQAGPTPPPPPQPVVPEKDPQEQNPPRLVAEVMEDHPRLLFGPADIPSLKRFAAGAGKAYFEELVKYRAACKPPAKPGFLRDATDGQRVGLWRMPTVALHYVLTGDVSSYRDALGYMKLLASLEHWETGKELDSGMSSANVLIGAALCYDWLYNDLPADFREQFRRKLLTMARRQYYGGHLNRNNATAYWQGDPANNHRWHRDAGMVLAALTAYEGDQRDNWLLARCKEEMELITRYLPPDGTSHEGPSYLIFGGAHLTLACQASDRCLGTNYLQDPFFANVPLFRLHTVWPGWEKAMPFGDGGGMGNYSNFLYKAAAEHRLAHCQDGLSTLHQANPKAWWLGWMSLLWKDPTLTAGTVGDLSTCAMFPDLGLVTLRDRWDRSGVGAMFKCGPLGGYRLNAYRNSRDFAYINVAHDDPDAASFLIFADGQILAETDRYSKRKKSANHNTILVNGVGQTVTGRKEGGVWSQPGRGDMTDMAVLTAYKRTGKIVLAEGEAGGAYPAIGKVCPGLERFRRTFIWAEGQYILVLDDIRAEEAVDVSWLMQGPDLVEVREATGEYILRSGNARCPFAVRADRKVADRIVAAPADDRGKALGWKQLRLECKTDRLRLVSVYDPWGRGLELQVDYSNPGRAKVVVSGKGFEDDWTWRPSEGRFEASTLRCVRDARPKATLGPSDTLKRPQ